MAPVTMERALVPPTDGGFENKASNQERPWLCFALKEWFASGLIHSSAESLH